MKTYDIIKNDRIYSFEINNWIIGRWGVCDVIKKIDGAKITKFPKSFSSFREECFCEFEINGHLFMVDEEYGDSSRYWIGSKSFEYNDEYYEMMTLVRDTFASYKPRFRMDIFSILIMLMIISLVFRIIENI